MSSGAQRSNASTPDVERKKTKEAGVEEEDQRSVAMDLERETSPVSEEEVDGPPSGCVLKRKFSDISCDSDDHSKDEVVDSVESDAFEGYIGKDYILYQSVLFKSERISSVFTFSKSKMVSKSAFESWKNQNAGYTL